MNFVETVTQIEGLRTAAIQQEKDFKEGKEGAKEPKVHPATFDLMERPRQHR